MAKTIRVTKAGEEAAKTQKGQSKELLDYIIKKYGVETEIDQSALVLDLNDHQKDTVVLSKLSTSPISRLYEFYRSKTWAKSGWVVVTSEPKKGGTDKKALGKWKLLEANHAKLVAHATKLEELLEANNIEFDELVFEEAAPEDAEELEAEAAGVV